MREGSQQGSQNNMNETLTVTLMTCRCVGDTGMALGLQGIILITQRSWREGTGEKRVDWGGGEGALVLRVFPVEIRRGLSFDRHGYRGQSSAVSALTMAGAAVWSGTGSIPADNACTAAAPSPRDGY